MTHKTFECPTHHVLIPAVSKSEADRLGLPFGCPACTKEMTAPLGVLTPAQRVTVLRALLTGPLTVPFDVMHKRIEEVVGRPVWTHEMADVDSLVAEIENGERASMDKVVSKLGYLMPGKPVIVVGGDEHDG
jgi:hypothetical protein